MHATRQNEYKPSIFEKKWIFSIFDQKLPKWPLLGHFWVFLEFIKLLQYWSNRAENRVLRSSLSKKKSSYRMVLLKNDLARFLVWKVIFGQF